MKRVSKRDRELIKKWIEPNPQHPWAGDARINTTGTSVWALIAYMDVADGDLDSVAEAYGLPLEAAEAAYAFYHAHWHAIEARLEMDAAWVDAWEK